MKKTINKKLSAYSASTIFFLAATTRLDAQVVYIDIDPDILLNGDCDGNIEHLDLNADGVNDFDISFEQCYGLGSNIFEEIKIAPLSSNLVAFSVASSSFGGCYGETIYQNVVPVIEGGLINGAVNFTGSNADLIKLDIHSMPCSVTNFFGSWLGAEDKYVGFKFVIDGAYHYGWLRLSIPEFSPYFGNTVILKDIAYQAQTGAPIPTVVDFVDAATWIGIADIGATSTGEDIQFTFNKAASELTIESYRVCAIKEADVASFTIADAYNLSSDQFVTIPAAGLATYTATFNATTLDIEGELLSPLYSYKLFIVSVANAASGDASILSVPSYTFMLDNVSATPATALFAEDVNDYFDSRDIKLSFSSIDVLGVSEYRILVAKSGEIVLVDDALLLSTDKYYSILASDIITDPAHITIDLLINDTDGDAITFGQDYYCYVLSLQNGVTSFFASISEVSNTFTLSATTEAVSDIIATDISNVQNGADLQVNFSKTTNEISVSMYQLYIVPEADASTFTIEAALAIEAANFTSIIPSGSDIIFYGSATTKDINGAFLENNSQYEIYVASIANPLYGTESILSTSTSITLITETAIATEVIASDISNSGNGSDLKVNFTKGENEIALVRYEVMVVPVAASDFFDLSAANTVSANGNFFEVLPTGFDIESILNSASVDVNGNLITFNEPYNIFIHSIDNGTGNGNKLSSPSDDIQLSDPNSIAIFENNVAFIYANNFTLHINFDYPLTQNVQLILTDITGKILFENTIQNQKNTIALSVASGVYLVSLNSNEQSVSKKIFVGN